MAREYRRLSPAEEDEIWARLRAGYAAKPTARALGQTHLPLALGVLGRDVGDGRVL